MAVLSILILTLMAHEATELHNIVIELFRSNPMIFSESQSQLCAVHGGTVGLMLTLNCPSWTLGRFLRIRKLDIVTFQGFSMCEVEVTGAPPPADDCSLMVFQTVQNSRLITASSPTAVYSNTKMECGIQCSDLPGCQGFNFNHVTKTCEMWITTDAQDNINSDPNWQMNYFR